MEEEAIQKPCEDLELINISQWEGLAVQLRESAIERGGAMMPPATPLWGPISPSHPAAAQQAG
jgi:hypothetical protein